jgi:hypothetical protein
MQHRFRLNGEKGILAHDAAVDERQAITDLWQELFGRTAKPAPQVNKKNLWPSLDDPIPEVLTRQG